MIRPELAARLTRHRETLAAAGLGVFGLWVAAQGGYLLTPLGLGLAGLGAAWGLMAWRRARFSRPVATPGLVDLDEGRVGYYGAGQGLGGYIALEDLSEIRLLHLRGAHYWRLKSATGEAVLIPVAATGSEKLYDAFASLPGIDMGALTAALDRRVAAQSLWRRP